MVDATTAANVFQSVSARPGGFCFTPSTGELWQIATLQIDGVRVRHGSFLGYRPRRWWGQADHRSGVVPTSGKQTSGEQDGARPCSKPKQTTTHAVSIGIGRRSLKPCKRPIRMHRLTNCLDGRGSMCYHSSMLRWTGWGWQVVVWVSLGASGWVTRQFGVVPGLVFLVVCVIATHVAYRASR